MCGIAGFADFKVKSTFSTLKRMTDQLHHRGPDDSGYRIFENNKVHIGLGHRRLSILDLSEAGHQPMSYRHLHLVYNGEIYNFVEIRKELEGMGYTFDSQSDTEVLLKAFFAWGVESVARLNGMFSFAIYDEQKEILYLFRDRSGIKPLYWYYHKGVILFASELKSFFLHPAFKKEIAKDAVALFLKHQYIPEPHTIFQKSYKLKAGHYLKISLNKERVEEICYWDVIDHYLAPTLDISKEEALSHLDILLKSSLGYRMRSDVPVGLFLSGGYDSGLVAALQQSQMGVSLKTFTIGFLEKGYDETSYAKAVATYLGTDHTEYYCTPKEALEIIPKLSYYYDEPFADSSAIPTILVSHLAKDQVGVVLSADGGDEIFAGYETYAMVLRFLQKREQLPQWLGEWILEMMQKIPPQKIPYFRNTYNFETRYHKIRKLLSQESSVDAMQTAMLYFLEEEVDALLLEEVNTTSTNFDLQKRVAQKDDLSQMLAIDYTTYLRDDILTKVDRATMSISLEGREPFLDYRIVEFMAKVPSSLKYKDGVQKYLLKELTHRYLPKKMMERPKMGFGVPLVEWFREELREYFLHYLDFEYLKKQNIFNPFAVVALRDRYLGGKEENIEKLWTILVFQLWYERWMEGV